MLYLFSKGMTFDGRMIRNTFSLAKPSYVKGSCTVIYRSKMSHGRSKKNFQTFSALNFIAAITQHIPERPSQMVDYYGWYSNRMRGDRLKAEQIAGDSDTKEVEGSKAYCHKRFQDQESTAPGLVGVH